MTHDLNSSLFLQDEPYMFFVKGAGYREIIFVHDKYYYHRNGIVTTEVPTNENWVLQTVAPFQTPIPSQVTLDDELEVVRAAHETLINTNKTLLNAIISGDI